jgi:hypothetical protein
LTSHVVAQIDRRRIAHFAEWPSEVGSNAQNTNYHKGAAIVIQALMTKIAARTRAKN